MIWYGWVLVAVIAVSTLVTIATVGKPRKPITGESAAVVVVINGLLIWAVIALGMHS